MGSASCSPWGRSPYDHARSPLHLSRSSKAPFRCSTSHTTSERIAMNTKRPALSRTSAMKALREGLRRVAEAPAHAWPPFSLLLAAGLAGASALRRESPPAPLLPDTGRRHALSSRIGARLGDGRRASWCCPTPPGQIRTRAAPRALKHTVQQLMAPGGAGMLEGWPVPATACLPWTPEGSAQRQRGLRHDRSAELRQGRQREERESGT